MFKKKRVEVAGIPRYGINVLGALKDNVTGGVKGGVKAINDTVGRTSRGFQATISKVKPKGLIPKQKIQPIRDLEAILGKISLKKTDKAAEEDKFLRAACKKNFLFADLNEDRMEDLVGAFERWKIKEDEYIFKEGDIGDYFYILYEGKLTFERDDEIFQTSEDFKPYCSFGEVALLHSTSRLHTVQASTDCVLFRLDQINFRLVLRQGNRTEDEKKIDFLRQVPALQDFETSSLAKLASAMEPHSFKKGEVLLNKGDEVKSFIVVHKGKLKAKDLSVGGSHYEDLVIGNGEALQSIGFNAMLNDDPIAGHVIALTDAKVLVIDGHTFRKFIGKYEHLATRRQKVIQISAMAIFKDSKLDSTEIAGLVDLMIPKEYRWKTQIFKRSLPTDAALYFVRRGKVDIQKESGEVKTIEAGGYFGVEQFLADQNKSGEGRPLVHAEYTATADAGTGVDILVLEEARAIIDTRKIGLGKSAKISAIDKNIDIEDLTRHVMLGAGSFGQVWLASYAKDAKKRRIFALKVQSKHQLIESNQAEGVVAEINIMASLKSPFIIRLYSTFQDLQRVYMLTSLLQGGELDDVIGDGLDEDSAKFYAAGILEGLTYMHRRHIIHRDLKPQNVMVDSLGYPVLIDLGFAKYVPDKTYTCCGTPMYMAPELINFTGHDKGVDHWSWAAMVYEMVTGHYAFYNSGIDEVTMYKKICKGEFKLNGEMSFEVKLLFISLFVPDNTKRLGYRPTGWQDIFKLPWFKDIDLRKLKKRELTAPWVPNLKNPLDSSNFESCEDVEDKMETDGPELTEKEQKIFDTFGPYTNEASY